MNNDTIFALSSGFGKSGVAVIRVSGNSLHDLFARLSGRADFNPRHAYFSNMRDNIGELIDQVICIYFAAPASFTGQDVIEIHCHGAPAVIQKTFEYLKSCGARMAEKGEFSRRAFYSGKMDLADVDGLAALLDAQTDKQRSAALRSLMGGDSKIYEDWRSKMIEIAAYSAAILDYADDELPANIGNKILSRTRDLYDELNRSISRYAAARAVRSGFNITLAGVPNVGKSSIFNCLVGSSRAIVSDIPGTTRDVVSAQLDIDGYLVNLSDTAGLRDGGDEIEKIGIEKSRTEIENADLVINVCTPTDAVHDMKLSPNELLVINKSDLIESKINPNAIYVSAKTGRGIDELLNAIKEKIHQLVGGAESDLTINARTYDLLVDAANELKNAIDLYNGNYDIFSEHIRRASDNIGKILGVITAADVMDATFSQLCLGK